MFVRFVGVISENMLEKFMCITYRLLIFSWLQIKKKYQDAYFTSTEPW